MADDVNATETVAKIEPEVVTELVKTEDKIETWKDGEQFDAAKAQALIEKLRTEIKELKPKAKHADELEAIEARRKEAEMTELEKAQKIIDELTAKAKAADLREIRRKIGEAAKLPAAIYELLPEGTEDEMKAKADELAKALPKPQPGLSATNPGASNGTITDEQRRAFLYGNGPLPH
jgi:hypothetical protein